MLRYDAMLCGSVCGGGRGFPERECVTYVTSVTSVMLGVMLQNRKKGVHTVVSLLGPNSSNVVPGFG